MADEPLRLRILKAITTCLQEITPDNGYVYDLSESVFRGRTIFGDGDPLPMVSILEPPVDLDQLRVPDGGDTISGPWNLLIQGFVEDEKDNPTDDAHLLLADVKKRLGLEMRKSRDFDLLGLGKHVTRLQLSPGVVRPPDNEVSSNAYFVLSVTLNVVECLANPYED